AVTRTTVPCSSSSAIHSAFGGVVWATAMSTCWPTWAERVSGKDGGHRPLDPVYAAMPDLPFSQLVHTFTTSTWWVDELITISGGESVERAVGGGPAGRLPTPTAEQPVTQSETTDTSRRRPADPYILTPGLQAW